MNIDLTEAIQLMIEKLREIEDKSVLEIITESISIYNFLYDQIAAGNRFFIFDTEDNVTQQIIFRQPKIDKDAWFNKD